MERPGPASASCSEDQGPMVLALSYSLLAIAIITVVLRVHFRFGLCNGLSSDDYTMVASVVSRLAIIWSLIAIADHALGRCHHRDRLFDQTGHRRTWKAYLVPASRTGSQSTEMEHHRPNIQHHWHRPSKDFRVPLCSTDHR